jgi:hypothetical protein
MAGLTHGFEDIVKRDDVATIRQQGESAALKARSAAKALRSMPGSWTNLATGSQVRPRWYSIPISAAWPGPIRSISVIDSINSV